MCVERLERLSKSGNRFSDKRRGENKNLEQFTEPSEVKTALERFPSEAAKEAPELLHANALALGQYGVLILGESGTGKSLLTLTLIERAQSTGRRAQLVADDYCSLDVEEGQLVARAPPTIRGAIEIRGAGLFSFPYQESVRLDLAIKLDKQAPRYPDDHHFEHFGIAVPCLHLPCLDGNIPLLAVCHAIEAHLFLRRWSSPLT